MHADLIRYRRLADNDCVNFCSNDYLGLSGLGYSSTKIGSTSSPALAGYSKECKALEDRFCECLGFDEAMLFSSGYQANIGVISGILGRGSVMLCDRFSHASIIDGGILSRASIIRHKHNDLEHIKELIKIRKPSLLVTESIYSMEGNISPLHEISELCHEHGVTLMVDDAHGFGVLGYNGLGAVDYWEFKNGKPDILVIPFGKALGASGAVVLASHAIINNLVQKARGYRYSTAISPFICQAVLQNLELIIRDNERRARLQQVIKLFNEQAHELPLVSNDLTPIRSIIIGDNQRTMKVADILFGQGFWVGGIRPPTVPEGTSRLRISLTAEHRDEQVVVLLQKLMEIL